MSLAPLASDIQKVRRVPWTDTDGRTIDERIAHTACGARITELSAAIDDLEREILRQFLADSMPAAMLLRSTRARWRERLVTLERGLQEHVRIMEAKNDDFYVAETATKITRTP